MKKKKIGRKEGLIGDHFCRQAAIHININVSHTTRQCLFSIFPKIIFCSTSGMPITFWKTLDYPCYYCVVYLSRIIKTGDKYLQTIFFFFVFLGPCSQPMDVPRIGVKSELQTPAYATATTTQIQGPSVCDLYCSSWHCQILNPLRRPGIKPTSSWILVWFLTSEPQQELLEGNLNSTM